MKSRAAVRLLRNPADSRTLWLLLCSSLLYATHWLTGSSAHWLVLPSFVLAISACVAKHNHVHAAVFRNRIFNGGLNLWLALLTGTSTTGIFIAHNQRHHSRSQSPEDFVRCSLVQRRSALGAFFCFAPLVVAQTWRHAAEDAGRLRRTSAGLSRALRFERAVIWLLIGFGLWQNWQQFLWVFALPWLAAQWFLITINLLQHDGLNPVDELGESRNVTGRCSNWLFLNNGYHTAHHLRPALHWSALPAFHGRELAAQIPPELESSSLGGLFFDWFKTRSPVRTPAGGATSAV